MTKNIPKQFLLNKVSIAYISQMKSMSVYACLSQKWESKYSEMAGDTGKMREHISYGNKK